MLKHANHNLHCFGCFAQLTGFFFFFFFFFLVFFWYSDLYIKLHFLSIAETKKCDGPQVYIKLHLF